MQTQRGGRGDRGRDRVPEARAISELCVRGSHAATLGSGPNVPAMARSWPARRSGRGRLAAEVHGLGGAGRECYNPHACIDFRILGPLEVTSESGPIALGGPRQRALLAALLLRVGRVVPTDQLVDELYGAEPPKTAIASLQNSVAALRKALGPDVLVTRSPGYVLTLSPEQIDARRFEQMLADARAASAEERRALLVRALDLWRGPPLAEFAFEEWAQTEARRLDELRAVAVEERIATEVELGRAADLVPELESLVLQHPLRERLRELLMLALYRAGRQAEALGRTPKLARRSTSSASSPATSSGTCRPRFSATIRVCPEAPTRTSRMRTRRS